MATYPQQNHNPAGQRQHQGQGRPPKITEPSDDAKKIIQEIRLADIKPDLFDRIARSTAQAVYDAGKAAGDKFNKPTQLRKFYDELTMWNERVQSAEKREDQYSKLAPFIKMMNAKVAYAKGREHVEPTFAAIFSHCIGEVKTADSLNHCKLFIEAFMGFYKELRPSDGKSL